MMWGFKKELKSFTKDNIMGFVAERVAIEITWHWLSLVGVDIEKREYHEGEVFDNSERYLLKVLNPPRIDLLMKKTIKPGEIIKDRFSSLRDLDGLILCQDRSDKYVIVVESKTDSYGIDRKNIENTLFCPLRDIYPESKIIYVLFSNMDSLYVGGNHPLERQANTNRIKDEPRRVADYLLDLGVGTVFFGFREGYEMLEKMAEHIMVLRKLYFKNPVRVSAEVIRDEQIKVFSGSQPQYVLRYRGNRTWEEVPIKDRKH